MLESGKQKFEKIKKFQKSRKMKNFEESNQEKLEIEMKSKTEIVGKSVSDENNLQSISVVLPIRPVYEKMASI